jgi:hypothetical protein
MVTSVLARGGCKRQILATADGLLRRGYQLEIFFATGEVEFTEEFSRLGIKRRHAFEAAESITRGYDREDVHGLVKFCTPCGSCRRASDRQCLGPRNQRISA